MAKILKSLAKELEPKSWKDQQQLVDKFTIEFEEMKENYLQMKVYTNSRKWSKGDKKKFMTGKIVANPVATKMLEVQKWVCENV